MRRFLLALALVLAAFGLLRLGSRPDLGRFEAYRLHATAPSRARQLSATYLGVATLVLSDGETTLLTDGFFTRPGILSLLGRIAPDRRRIADSLERAGVQEAAAVLVVHSHFDHSMDAPEVARRTGAVLVGSASTANVGRGWGLGEAQIRVVVPGEPLQFGAFRVTFLASRHVPLPFSGLLLGHEITAPLVPPVRASAYEEGGTFSVLVEHPLGNLLVQGSAGFREGALSPYRAHTVLLGVGALGGRDEGYRETYFREVVESVEARRVIPIHYDDFTIPLEEPLRAFPRLVDDLEGTLSWLITRTQAEPRRELAMLPVWQPVVLFEAD